MALLAFLKFTGATFHGLHLRRERMYCAREYLTPRLLILVRPTRLSLNRPQSLITAERGLLIAARTGVYLSLHFYSLRSLN